MGTLRLWIGIARLGKEVFLQIGVVCLWTVTVGQEIKHAVSPGAHGAVCSDADRAACLRLDAVCLGAEDAAVYGEKGIIVCQQASAQC